MSYCHVCHLVDWVTTLATIDVVVKDKVSHNRYTLLCAHCSPWPQQTSEATAFRSVGLYRDACAKDSHFVGHHTIVNEVDAVRNFNGTSRSPNTITTPKNATMPGFLYPARFTLPPVAKFRRSWAHFVPPVRAIPTNPLSSQSIQNWWNQGVPKVKVHDTIICYAFKPPQNPLAPSK